MNDNWNPGAVALVSTPGLSERRATWATTCPREAHPATPHWHIADRDTYLPAFAHGLRVRPLAVIDSENREQVERLARASHDAIHRPGSFDSKDPLSRGVLTDLMQAALREFASPTPTEPSDPKARVSDRRDNIWRLLADGDWVCVCGPDIGEYIAWSRLAAERGPLTVEVPA